MKKLHCKCENCGAEVIVEAGAECGRCEYCGAVYYLDRQKPAEVHHYFGNVKITPARIVLAISVVAVLAAAIVILALYFSGVFSEKTPPVSNEFRHEKAYLYEGTYLVGEDMDEGEFVAFKAPAEKRGRILVLTDPNASAGTSACLAEYTFANNSYFTVKKGMYVKVEDCNVFRVGDKTVDSMADGSFEGNIVLRGGTDIPVGNYILINDDKNMRYASITCDIGGNEYRKTIGSRTHLTIGEGDYVYLTLGKLYAESNAPMPITGENGEYPFGQYKVGLDIQAGRYRLYSGNASMVAYFVQNKDGFAFFDKSEQISSSTMSGYVDLEDGDYIYLYMIELVPVDGEQ
ncbi:MAG: hypothetical protein HDT36_02420 [Clostridiales bacterium]|nr:hypothetical protein [Clostridiales bacterium]